MDMGLLKDIYGIDSIIIREHAKHGLTGVTSTISLEDNSWYSSFVKNMLNGQDTLHVQTHYSLFGGIKSDIIIDEFSIAEKDVPLHVKKADFKITSDRSMQNYNFTGNWGGFDIDQKLSFNDLSMVMDRKIVTWLPRE